MSDQPAKTRDREQLMVIDETEDLENCKAHKQEKSQSK